MSLEALQTLVAAEPQRFSSSVRENSSSLAAAERQLGVGIPSAVKWFLCECGYSDVAAIPNLDEAVSLTLALRERISLPDHLIAIDDRGDAGVVLLDASSEDGAVVWSGASELESVATDGFSNDADVFPTFTHWVTTCLRDV